MNRETVTSKKYVQLLAPAAAVTADTSSVYLDLQGFDAVDIVATYSNVSPLSAILGFICRATNAAVACSHPMSADTRSSTGWGCSSLPPIFFGRSVRTTCPRVVVVVVPPTPVALSS